MFVLDVLRHDDCESIASIVRLLNDDSGSIGWRDLRPQGFSEEEVSQALQLNATKGFVVRLEYSTKDNGLIESSIPFDPGEERDSEEVWFALTQAGRQTLEKWVPPNSTMK